MNDLTESQLNELSNYQSDAYTDRDALISKIVGIAGLGAGGYSAVKAMKLKKDISKSEFDSEKERLAKQKSKAAALAALGIGLGSSALYTGLRHDFKKKKDK
jgi:hypothetical protein